MHAKTDETFWHYSFVFKFSKSQSEEKPQLQLYHTPHSPRDVKQIGRPCVICFLEEEFREILFSNLLVHLA